jgi:hypothetical protein
MNDNDINSRQNDYKPYWKRAHRTISFWIFVFLMFVGIVYYIISLDFAFAPRTQPKQTMESNRLP